MGAGGDPEKMMRGIFAHRHLQNILYQEFQTNTIATINCRAFLAPTIFKRPDVGLVLGHLRPQPELTPARFRPAVSFCRSPSDAELKKFGQLLKYAMLVPCMLSIEEFCLPNLAVLERI